MDFINDITFEPPIEVSVVMNDCRWTVSILRSFDHVNMESDFLIVIENQIIGHLQINYLMETWHSVEGNFSDDEAAIIGREIDKYYDLL